jgi:3-oxoacyl-[acyl-carrier-protein] synthase II
MTLVPLSITGLGAVAPHGDSPDAIFAAVMRGESAVQAVFPELPKPTAAAVTQFDPARWFNKLQLAGVDRVSQLAVAAADLAIKDANATDCDPERIGIYVGCGMGGAGSLEAAYRGASNRVPPLTVPAFMPNAPASHIAMRQKVLGPVLTYSVACSSSAVAIAEAAKAVQSGEVDVAIAGGTEALIVPGVVLAWQAMQTLAGFDPADAQGAARSVRPFSADRSGFALGEGSAFLVIESEARAKARGARRYATLSGWGISTDATHLTKPDAPGQARALRAALQRAGLQPRDVGYCNAHGTATRIGDPIECEALAQVWGGDVDRLRVSSTKGLHGHLLGAAGALEAMLTVMALHQRQLPPNANLTEADPACALNLVTETGLAAPQLEAAISSSFAFGGSNAVLLFQRA